MGVMGLYLFKNRSGFGLYKLAMYAQPVFLAVLVTAWLGFLSRRRGAAPAEAGGPARGPAPHSYGRRVAFVAFAGGRWSGSACCLEHAVGATPQLVRRRPDVQRNPRRLRLARYNEFREIVDKNEATKKPGQTFQYLADTYNLVLAKFQSLGNRKHEMSFPSNRFYYPGGYVTYPTLHGRELIRTADEMMAVYAAQFRWDYFRVHEHDTTGVKYDPNADAAGDDRGDGDATTRSSSTTSPPRWPTASRRAPAATAPTRTSTRSRRPRRRRSRAWRSAPRA